MDITDFACVLALFYHPILSEKKRSRIHVSDSYTKPLSRAIRMEDRQGRGGAKEQRHLALLLSQLKGVQSGH